MARPAPAEPPAGYVGWPLWYHRVCLVHNRAFGWLFIAGLAVGAMFPHVASAEPAWDQLAWLSETARLNGAGTEDTMAYFVTGATGFIGRFLLAELLDHREGTIYCLCRASSLDKLDELKAPTRRRRRPHRAGHGRPLQGAPGVDADEIERLTGSIEHFFHLAAIYDLTADADSQRSRQRRGHPARASQLAEALHAGHFHQVSSIAAAGLYRGVFTEDMFEEAQDVEHNPYYPTKHESEAVVRKECAVPWRVYRPGVVVGHSRDR